MCLLCKCVRVPNTPQPCNQKTTTTTIYQYIYHWFHWFALLWEARVRAYTHARTSTPFWRTTHCALSKKLPGSHDRPWCATVSNFLHCVRLSNLIHTQNTTNNLIWFLHCFSLLPNAKNKIQINVGTGTLGLKLRVYLLLLGFFLPPVNSSMLPSCGQSGLFHWGMYALGNMKTTLPSMLGGL